MLIGCGGSPKPVTVVYEPVAPQPIVDENSPIPVPVYDVPEGVPPGVVFYNRYYYGCDCFLTVYPYNGYWYNAYEPGVILYRGPWVFRQPSIYAWNRWHQYGGSWHGSHLTPYVGRPYYRPYRHY